MFTKKYNYIFILFLFSCATPPLVKTEAPPIIEKKEINPAQVFLSQGEAKALSLYLDPYLIEVAGQLECGGNNTPYLKKMDGIKFYISISYRFDFSIKKIPCFLIIDGKSEYLLTIIPVEKDYPKESLRVNPKLVFPSVEMQNKINRDNELLNRIWQFPYSRNKISSTLIKPVDSKETSQFGVNRTFNKTKQDIHYGLDLRGAIGTPIQASESGKVVWVGDLAIPGKTLIVAHGDGLFTMYSHLSKVISQVGDDLTQGEVLGEVGATGRVSGPHLHWSVIVHGNWVNPKNWLKDQVDKK